MQKSSFIATSGRLCSTTQQLRGVIFEYIWKVCRILSPLVSRVLSRASISQHDSRSLASDIMRNFSFCHNKLLLILPFLCRGGWVPCRVFMNEWSFFFLDSDDSTLAACVLLKIDCFWDALDPPFASLTGTFAANKKFIQSDPVKQGFADAATKTSALWWHHHD